MPTGYTHAVAEGTITSPREFILSCAPAFGAFIEFREEHLKPEDIKPELFDRENSSSYYEKKLKDAEDALGTLLLATEDEITLARTKWNDEQKASRARYIKENTEKRKNYETMIAAVEAWDPGPTDVKNVKAFALQQLRDSLKSDCPTNKDYWYGGSEFKDNLEYFDFFKNSYEKDIAYATKELKRENESTKNCKTFVTELLATLKGMK